MLISSLSFLLLSVIGIDEQILNLRTHLQSQYTISDKSERMDIDKILSALSLQKDLTCKINRLNNTQFIVYLSGPKGSYTIQFDKDQGHGMVWGWVAPSQVETMTPRQAYNRVVEVCIHG